MHLVLASEIVTHIFSESRKVIKLVLLWEDTKVISSSNISMFQLLFRGSESSGVVLLVAISGGFCSSGHGQNSCAKINRWPVVLLDILIHLGCQLVVWKSHEDSPKSSYTSHSIGRKDAFASMFWELWVDAASSVGRYNLYPGFSPSAGAHPTTTIFPATEAHSIFGQV